MNSAIFLEKVGSGMHSDPKFSQRGGGVSSINARKKTFWNAILVCVLLRKNFLNGGLAHSAVRMPLNMNCSTVKILV
jgi:hypothetical protein